MLTVYKICSVLLLLPTLAVAEIYRSVDSEGHPIFSDKPAKGSQVVSLPPLQSFSGSANGATIAIKVSPANTPLSAEALKMPLNKAPVSASVYTDLSIASPSDQASISNTGGQMEVLVALSPNLQNGDKIIITVDDEPVAESQEQNVSFLLEGIPRGTHQLQAYVMGSDAHILKSAKPITFFMHQTTAEQFANTHDKTKPAPSSP